MEVQKKLKKQVLKRRPSVLAGSNLQVWGTRKPNAPISASAPEAVSPDGGLGPLEPPETDAPEMSDLLQGIEDRADESGGSAAQRVATLSYSFASEIPGGLLDVTT